MHGCEHARRALLDAVDGELSWFGRLRLRVHLWLCPGCRREAASVDRTMRLLRRCGSRCDASAAPPAESRSDPE